MTTSLDELINIVAAVIPIRACADWQARWANRKSQINRVLTDHL
jgi:hypothetical protein